MGVFPYLPASRIQERYTPFVEDLSAVLHTPVKLKTRVSFQAFQVAVVKQEYDLIFIQPFDYVRTGVKHGYQAIARPEFELRAVFVVLPDSRITNLKQLKGRRIAMPPKDAAVSLLGLKLLIDNSFEIGKDVTLSFQSNHFACMRQLIIKKVDACVTADVPRKMFERRSEVNLRLLSTTQSIPPALFAVHQRVPEQERLKIISTMANWSQTPAGRKILNGLQFKTIIPTDDHAYDVVREIWKSIKNRQPFL